MSLPQTDNLLIEINNLTSTFTQNTGQVVAVNNSNFSINKGEVVGVVGESGSGKSITALSMMGLHAYLKNNHTTGQIKWHGTSPCSNLLELSEKEWLKYRANQIGMIFQEPMSALNPLMSCGSQIVEVLVLHQTLSASQAKSIALEWLEKVKLPDVERIFNAYPHELSGGQKQRVMIAMALCCKPALLIADEPTTALDVTVQQDIILLLKQLQRELGMAIIFISHDLGVVRQIASKVIVMRLGKIVEESDIHTLFTQPKAIYTKSLLAARPPIDKQLYRLPVEADFLNENPPKQQKANIFIPTATLLEVNNLSVHYTSKKGLFSTQKQIVKAVDDVSFQLFKGESLGLVGESGCGKTTLSKTLLHFLTPTVGSVLYDGILVNNLQGKALRNYRKKVQIIFQDPYSSLNPRHGIGATIAEVVQFYNPSWKLAEVQTKVYELLHQVELPRSFYNKYPHQLSGGQRQRVVIARALATQPEMIICDEPVSALDVSVQATVLNLLKDLQEQQQLSYLFISHDLSVVRFMCNRIMVMENGKIVERGEAAAIFGQPQQAYTQKLIDAIP